MGRHSFPTREKWCIRGIQIIQTIVEADNWKADKVFAVGQWRRVLQVRVRPIRSQKY